MVRLFVSFIILIVGFAHYMSAQSCQSDTISTDILFVIDNSQSIDTGEYRLFEQIILSTINKVQAKCSKAQVGVVHYGGDRGQSVNIEYPLRNNNTITQLTRQFCPVQPCAFGGDDLNFAMGRIIQYFNNGSLNRDTANDLRIVIFTDAFGEVSCSNSNCSVILPTTNIDILKSSPFDAKVAVVGVSSQANKQQLAIYASPGGSYGPPNTLSSVCGTSFDGCQLPRKYIPLEFFSPVGASSDSIAACVDCTFLVKGSVEVSLGPDKTICSNLNESVVLTANVLSGQPPFMFSWNNGLGTGNVKTVNPSSNTVYSVTVTDNSGCIGIDEVTVTTEICDNCESDAGMPKEHNDVCLINGKATLITTPNMNTVVPAGFETVYILTNSDLVIIDYRIGSGSFMVSKEGTYRIHTLIAEVTNRNSPDYLDLSIIKINQSNLFIIVNCIAEHGVCADFDYPGRVHRVFGPNDMMCMTFENSITLCSDGIDNDGDGLVDCKDPDCKAVTICWENTLLACNDLYDNDQDGLIDCYDSDCWQFSICFEKGAQCSDGKDNDGDGLIDCADPSCSSSSNCFENSPITCSDGKDNDGDGLIDCQEASCRRFIVCAEYSAAACSDGIDNDFDGLVDCADMNCMMLFPTMCSSSENSPSLCSDGIDNDNDGLVDCADSDCGFVALNALRNSLSSYITTTKPTCPNNNNGVIQLVGPLVNSNYQYTLNNGTKKSNPLFSSLSSGTYTISIFTASGCNLSTSVTLTGSNCAEICNDGIDNDGDGLKDCADPDCGITGFEIGISTVNPTCPSKNNGRINIAGQKSGLSYTYSKDGGFNYQNSPNFTGLMPRVYLITIKSSSGCIFNKWVTIADIQCGEVCNNNTDDDGDGQIDCNDNDCSVTEAKVNIVVTQPTCPLNSNGSINVTSKLQGVSYEYSINNGLNFQSNGLFSGLSGGTGSGSKLYTLVVKSSTGCLFNKEITLTSQACSSASSNSSEQSDKVVISARAILQGAYNPESGKMTTFLNDLGYLPGQKPKTFFGQATKPGQPYNTTPWNYEGQEKVDSYQKDVVDWVLVSLRSDLSQNSESWKGAGLIHSDGTIKMMSNLGLEEVEEGGYYIVIEHRNHLPIMSPSKVPVADGIISFDFVKSNSYTSVIGVGQVVLADGSHAMIAGNGELNTDATSPIDINAKDFNLWLLENGANSQYLIQDYDLNGDVNVKDRIIWESNNGLFSSVPNK